MAQPPSSPALLDADARTDATGLATLTLKAVDEDGGKPGDGPFLLRISSNGGTIDTTTGETPAITSVSTIISAAQFANRANTRFYATPFTSLAIERAKSRVIAAGGDSSDTAAVEAELAAAVLFCHFLRLALGVFLRQHKKRKKNERSVFVAVGWSN